MSDVEHAGRRAPRLVVVVPARNEVERVGACLGSLADQQFPLRVMLSDNASHDGTAIVAADFSDRLDIVVRTTEPLGPGEHFVSSGRWALMAESQGALFALIAGDDAWSADFARSAVEALERHPEADVAFPAFIWAGDEVGHRYLPPVSFLQPDGGARQRRGLLLPDRRELANLVYGVYRRAAFEDLLIAWERGGDAFASDYAAAWSVLARHKVVSCADAVGLRHVRSGADLIERVELSRTQTASPIALMMLYFRLNLRINRLIGSALQRVATGDGHPPTPLQVQVLRAPQWLGGSIRQVRWVTVRFRRNRVLPSDESRSHRRHDG